MIKMVDQNILLNALRWGSEIGNPMRIPFNWGQDIGRKIINKPSPTGSITTISRDLPSIKKIGGDGKILSPTIAPSLGLAPTFSPTIAPSLGLAPTFNPSLSIAPILAWKPGATETKGPSFTEGIAFSQFAGLVLIGGALFVLLKKQKGK